MKKMRLDHLLVERGLAENPSKARARIMAGDVIADEHRADKPGLKFRADVPLRLRGPSHPYASRGGLKLEHAFQAWSLDVSDAVCLDVGASTGGFTDVLLRHGARLVYAVDVGYGQLAQHLREDPRVVCMERQHILDLSESALPEKPSVAVIDVSFISLKKILAHVADLLSDKAIIIALVKPQFEAGREHIGKGGIVKDPAVHQAVLADIRRYAEAMDLAVIGIEESPIKGMKGNAEFLMAMAKGSPRTP